MAMYNPATSPYKNYNGLTDLQNDPRANFVNSGVDNSLMGTTSYSPQSLRYDPTMSFDARNQQQQAVSNLDESNKYYKGLMYQPDTNIAQQQTNLNMGRAQVQGMQAASAARGIDRAAAFRQAQANATGANAVAAREGGIASAQEHVQNQQMRNQAAQGFAQGNMAQAGTYGAQRTQDVQEQQGQEALQNQQNAQYVDLSKSNATNSQKGTGSIIGGIGSAVGSVLSDEGSKENVAKAPEAGKNVPYFEQPKQEAAPPPSDSGSKSPLSMLSDEDKKSEVHPLDKVKPYTFDYKDDAAHKIASDAAKTAYARAFMDAKEPREGVMAQDLQKSPETSSMVQRGDAGLEIDGKRALAFLMGHASQLNERLNRLEGSNGSRA